MLLNTNDIRIFQVYPSEVAHQICEVNKCTKSCVNLEKPPYWPARIVRILETGRATDESCVFVTRFPESDRPSGRHEFCESWKPAERPTNPVRL